MLFAVAAVGITAFCLVLRWSLMVARMRDLPAWRRCLPLVLLLTAPGASLLRAVDIPQAADAVAFPLNLAALTTSRLEIRAHRRRNPTAPPAG